MVSLFLVYKLDTWSRNLSTEFTLRDCWFGAIGLAKNVDPDKYG